ncbi:MAG: biotin--[acetyl-CoA-carboxylase] ligase [Syntrophales bacterium]|nr:biotin--[acetyl-CoA-carboxylase] ligase [Syntrophales bacterium]
MGELFQRHDTVNRDFNGDDLEGLIPRGSIGHRVHFFDTIDSTNIYASVLAGDGAPEGEVVLADCQTAGRGRLRERKWYSPPGKNLYTSIILRPDISPAFAPGLTLVAGVAIAELLGGYCPVSLKWPNDVLAGGRKISGILTEMKSKGSKIDFVVVGIGINVNMEPDDFQEELRLLSTSLKEQTSKNASRLELTTGLYRLLEKWYRIFIDRGFVPVRDRWLECSGMVGKTIEVADRGTLQRGICQGIDDEGVLLLLDKENRTLSIWSGDITIQKDR